MPIDYSVHGQGHYIYAIASGTVTAEEFIAYEVAHAIDERIQTPLYELLEIGHDACRLITRQDVQRVLDRRKEIDRPPTPHRCAIVPSLSDNCAWDLAKFYEGMICLHYPESVIVFADVFTAKTWLGIKDTSRTDPRRDWI
ncbi:MAG: hypothetical protein JW810_08590 [Sedimentisphaerales bacterium]|nr:hypothetical protein [Sedimentisphaerales bacterium]